MATRNRTEGGPQGQGNPAEPSPGTDFNKQLDKNLRDRMHGEHSLQVDHDGKSFRQSEQGGRDDTGPGQVQQHQQYPQRSAGRPKATGTSGGPSAGSGRGGNGGKA